MIHRINVSWEQSMPIDLHCQDRGQGPPVVMVHGWPLASACWAPQVDALLAAGHRVVTYDRRGCGQSSWTRQAYDADTLADDLYRLIGYLDLQGVCLIGYSTGVGEIARLLGTYGSERIERAMLITGTPPNDDRGALETTSAMVGAMVRDRPRFIRDFLTRSYQCADDGIVCVSEAVLDRHCDLALAGSPVAGQAGLAAWATDLRDDLRRIDLPCLVMHGGGDRILPVEHSGRLLHEGIAGSQLVVLEGAPHGLLQTHADCVNREIGRFLAHA